MDNAAFRLARRSPRRCCCGTEYLREDGSVTHVCHTLSCFLRHHTYVRLADRDGAHEYVCARARWVRRVCVPLRPQLSQAARRRADDPSSARL
ncbi:MAG: hypothetical protein ACRD09_09595, partial [Vicinamibacterales bacterium]